MTQMAGAGPPRTRRTRPASASGNHTGSNSCCVVEAVRLASARVATSIVNRSDVPFSQQRSNTSLLPVGRPRRVRVDERVVREAHDTAPVREHEIELGESTIPVRDERDAGPVGRPHGGPVGGARRLCRRVVRDPSRPPWRRRSGRARPAAFGPNRRRGCRSATTRGPAREPGWRSAGCVRPLMHSPRRGPRGP